ncbi:hypothetical protein ACVIHI_008767 [Bradyrhizobium sp. USDA 4524]|nr:hypothetical protein [Bradyrhizobium sp. USDA 4538]MCP1906909.1 hypothetical protein [Bradyrhizobium sp. USDA 4537]MCP1985384.1 hypothetical protein [Bradyrhizobium sp. USDA 4539]
MRAGILAPFTSLCAMAPHVLPFPSHSVSGADLRPNTILAGKDAVGHRSPLSCGSIRGTKRRLMLHALPVEWERSTFSPAIRGLLDHLMMRCARRSAPSDRQGEDPPCGESLWRMSFALAVGPDCRPCRTRRRSCGWIRRGESGVQHTGTSASRCRSLRRRPRQESRDCRDQRSRCLGEHAITPTWLRTVASRCAALVAS